MESFGNIASKRVKIQSIAPKVEVAMIIVKFNEMLEMEFGSAVKTRARALYLKGDCMCIGILSSAMAQELKFKEKMLIETINGYYEKDVVGRIRYMC